MAKGPGRPPDVTDTEILEAFRNSKDPVLTATELSQKLPIERRGILSRLEKLEEEGYLESKKVGSRSTVWWYPGNTSTKPVDPES